MPRSNVFWRAWRRFNFRNRAFRFNNPQQKVADNILKIQWPIYQQLYSQNATTSLYKNVHSVLKEISMYGAFTHGNQFHVYNEGSLLFRDLWNEMDNAKDRIWMEVYTLAADTTGLRTLQSLTNAAKRGCDVILLIDGWGSSLHSSYLEPLEKAGGKVIWFNKLHYWQVWKWKQNFERNHKKVCIVDNRVAFFGGMNISDDYNSKEVFPSGKLVHEMDMKEIGAFTSFVSKHSRVWGIPTRKLAFRDTHSKVIGPGVSVLANLFLDALEDATGRHDYHYPIPCVEADEDESSDEHDEHRKTGKYLQILPSNPRKGRNLYEALASIICNAKQRCYITTPYFSPPKKLANALFTAVEKGVDIRVLTSGYSDVPHVKMAYLHNYGKYLKRGVKIYEYFGRILHAKSICVDGFFWANGSFNVDRMSYYKNLEIGAICTDVQVAYEQEQRFMEDLKCSEQLTYEKWKSIPLYAKMVAHVLYRTMHFFERYIRDKIY